MKHLPEYCELCERQIPYTEFCYLPHADRRKPAGTVGFRESVEGVMCLECEGVAKVGERLEQEGREVQDTGLVGPHRPLRAVQRSSADTGRRTP